MYRARIHQEVIYGHFREFLQVTESFRALSRERGWTDGTLWVPTAGRGNVVIWETEYPDLASFQRENEAVYSDKEAMDLIRQFSPHVVQGSVHTELLEEAPSIA
jgi:hypothetical protein